MIILKIFNGQSWSLYMAGIFDSIPIITVVLFALGLVGVIVYERSRSNSSDESDSWIFI